MFAVSQFFCIFALVKLIKIKNMLIVHIISTDDTRQFSTIYRGIENDNTNRILINPTSSQLRQSIIKETDRIVLIGHGTENGLLNQNLNGYIIDSGWVNLLRGRNVIGIWCNASNFGDRYDLTGFFTSMFISNRNELIECGFDTFDGCEDEITRQNEMFSIRVNELLVNNIPTSEWSTRLNNMLTENEHRFVLYNYEAMYSTEINQ